MYYNLRGLYLDLYKYEKKKFNEMDKNKKKEAYKDSIFNILNKYNKSVNKRNNNPTQEHININENNRNHDGNKNNDFVEKIKQDLFDNEDIILNLFPLKSKYNPNIKKIIECCKIDKDKYSLRRSIQEF